MKFAASLRVALGEFGIAQERSQSLSAGTLARPLGEVASRAIPFSHPKEMSMKCSALFSLMIPLVFAAACTQGSDQKASPTEPTAAVSASAEQQLGGGAAEDVSSVCEAYQERLDTHRATLEHFPHDEAATEAVATYTSLLADACS
jgi:hypothetical protein